MAVVASGSRHPTTTGIDFISLYHGDGLARLVSNLLPDERAFVEDDL